MLLLAWEADAWLKQNMSCWSEALVQFSREKPNELTDQQDMFYHKAPQGGE